MLHDGNFLSALAALAEIPDRILSLFDMENTTANRVWTMRLFKFGIPEDIVTDTLVPCIDDNPCFARTQSDDLWVMIL